MELEPTGTTAGISASDGRTPIDGATWYTSSSVGDSITYDLGDERLPEQGFLSFDLLVDESFDGQFKLTLHEATSGSILDRIGEALGVRRDEERQVRLLFQLLPQCRGRVRLALDRVNDNVYELDRAGAVQKPVIGGRVDLSEVSKVTLTVIGKDYGTLRWCQTPLRVTDAEPEPIRDPELPEGPLVDELGQSTIHDWPGQTETEAQLRDRIDSQVDEASRWSRPPSYSRWGGWSDREFEATGYFRLERDDRWWLVDPDGHPFFSTGVNRVHPVQEGWYEGLEDALSWLPEPSSEGPTVHDPDRKVVNYLGANWRRARGSTWHDDWWSTTVSLLTDAGVNSIGNWSDWEQARGGDVPYVRSLEPTFEETPTIMPSFPDVYDPAFESEAREQAQALSSTASDPALLGYFVDNEPEWLFLRELPAAGMLYRTESCAAREEFAAFLRDRHDDLGDAWEADVSFEHVEHGRWTRALPDAATEDLEAFSAEMTTRLYRTLCDACADADPNHLNLGLRLQTPPPEWAHPAMRDFDVISINSYSKRIPKEAFATLSEGLDAPLLIGEWSFGALDAGLPSPGLCQVDDQSARATAVRAYLEDAASSPWCVGAHYYQCYDQSFVGREDGENFNMGLLDVCHRPYEEVLDGLNEAHQRLYEVASGEASAVEADVEFKQWLEDPS